MTLLQAAAGEISAAVAKQAAIDAAKRHFRPEFLNRLDDIVVFEPLSKQQLLYVAQAQVAGLQSRLKPRNISLRLSDAALAFAVASAYDPQYGARPLRRWLEQHVITDLARLVISGQLPENSDVVCDVSAAGVGGAGGGAVVIEEEDGGSDGGGAAAGRVATASDGSGLVYRITAKPPEDEEQAGAGGRAETPRAGGLGGAKRFLDSMNNDDEEDEEDDDEAPMEA
jgi:hypothetical protein